MKHCNNVSIIGLSTLITVFATPAWADIEFPPPPIPEPSSIGAVVLGIGVAWLIVRSRRK